MLRHTILQVRTKVEAIVRTVDVSAAPHSIISRQKLTMEINGDMLPLATTQFRLNPPPDVDLDLDKVVIISKS